jgi:hypothetical protein
MALVTRCLPNKTQQCTPATMEEKPRRSDKSTHVLTLVQPFHDANAADTQYTHLKPVHHLDYSGSGSPPSHYGRNWPQPLPNARHARKTIPATQPPEHHLNPSQTIPAQKIAVDYFLRMIGLGE